MRSAAGGRARPTISTSGGGSCCQAHIIRLCLQHACAQTERMWRLPCVTAATSCPHASHHMCPRALSEVVMSALQCINLQAGRHELQRAFSSVVNTVASRSALQCGCCREQTLHWAIWQQLKSPPPGFEDVIRSHYQLRRAELTSTCQTWISEARATDSNAAARMQTYLDNALALIPAP